MLQYTHTLQNIIMPRQTWAACIVCILQITEHLWWNYIYNLSINTIFYTFVGSVRSFGFSFPPQRSMTSDYEGFSIPYFIHYIYFPILILWKEPVFSFWMLSAKQGHYCYHFYNVFGMTPSLTGDWTRDLPHSMPALYH